MDLTYTEFSCMFVSVDDHVQCGETCCHVAV